MKKLHLGCGTKILDDYDNYDNVDNTGLSEVLCHDATDLSFLKDDSVDEIVVFYLLEHLTYEEVSKLLFHASKKLVEGGKIKILVPDFGEITEYYQTNQNDILKLQLLSIEVYICGQEGGHKSIWNKTLLTHYLTCEGFFEVALTRQSVGSKRMGIYIEAVRTSEQKYYNQLLGGDAYKEKGIGQ